MSFAAEFATLPVANLLRHSLNATTAAARRSLENSALSLQDFANLISPAGAELLEALGQRSQRLTRQRFGKVIRLFAPLYLSNECINNCRYCGFSRDNPILRVTLTLEEVRREARALLQQGFRNILLVAGEHPKFVSTNYLSECVAALHPEVPSLSLEVGPLPAEEYRPLVAAGAEGLVVYQETYDRGVYADMHTAGPKRDFDWRLETPERAYAAGFRRLGISALYGLADWRAEAISVAAHAGYLLRHCWKAGVTISLTRRRPCAGEFQPLTQIGDRELIQLMCAFRLMFPDVGLVLSTRESPKMRNGLIPLGVTLMSAGSHTGAGREHLHLSARGRTLPAGPVLNDSTTWPRKLTQATEQFNIADTRSAQEVAEVIRGLGYDPVWKDWDRALTA